MRKRVNASTYKKTTTGEILYGYAFANRTYDSTISTFLRSRMMFLMQIFQTRFGNMRINLRGGNIGVP